MATKLSLAREISRTLGRSSRRRDKWAHVALALVGAISTIQVDAAELPVPCIAGSCGSVARDWNNDVASATISGNTLNIQQRTDSATLNWAQFNISADGVVNFQQPSASSTAINHIHQNDPSRIFGSLNANGRVYLLNRNGVLFGTGSKVNVAGMVASSLNMSEAAVERGIAGAATQGNQHAFEDYRDPTTGEVLASGDIRVEAGATITTADGGQVLMFAPEIVNEGSISTPGGQTLLAAGSSRVYLVTSSDANLRGLLVEVETGGTATNVGEIVAERGNVTLAGLAVNQLGRVSATTTVREGGSIRLQARDGGSVESVGSGPQLKATNGGELTLGQGSVTQVTLAYDPEATPEKNPDEFSVDVNAQPPSQVQLQGHQIHVLEQARITATGGKIDAVASAVPGASSPDIKSPTIHGTVDDGSRIYIAEGALLDVSGASVELDMERNVVRAELRGDELADSPIQRDGALRGQAVFVDMRLRGTRADGTTWVGTPIGNLSGQVSLVTRNVAERNLNGGTVSLASQGDVIVAAGSKIDLSGGVARYRDGYINTTQLLGSDGRIYDIADADPNLTYVGTTETYVVDDRRWGQKETFRSFGHTPRFEEGYVEGKDAGQLALVAPEAILDGDITAQVTVGRHQRERATALAAGQTYRAYDELPLGAKLVLGKEPEPNADDQVAGAIVFENGLVLPGLRSQPDAPFDPESDPLDLTHTRLRPELFGESRFSRAEIHSNDSVELPQDVSLRLPGQGELSIAAGQIRFDGQFHAVGGKVELDALLTETVRAPDIALDVGSGAVLDVSGMWVNDSWRFTEGQAQLPPLLIGGGAVELSSDGGSLNLAQGGLINVSAGAWLRDDGTIVAGNAGSITMSASRDLAVTDPVALNLGATLMGYGVENGGSLSISAPEICLAAAGHCGAGSLEGLLTLRPEQLLAGGFGKLALTSNERGLTVAAGTQIDLRQSNWVLDADAQSAATGTAMDQIASVSVLPDHLRSAMDLTLRTAIPDPLNNVRYDNETFDEVPVLTVQAGAAIRGDAGATIALRSNSSLFIDGSIEAHAGTIDLRLDNTLPISAPVSSQGIWLGTHGRLDASGTTVYQPNEYGLRQGEVLNGGRVQVTAERGVFIANPGSRIDVSGTSAELDIRSPDSAVNEGTPTLIASNGGRVDIRAADGVLLNGDIDAHAGQGSQGAIGGDLRVTLDASQRNLQVLPIAGGERRIVVTQQSNPLALGMGTALPESFSQRALLAADDIEAAGFDSVTLSANTTTGTTAGNTQFIDTGAIEFDGDVTLSVGRSLVLDTARITGDGDVSISAPYVAIGHTEASFQQTPTPGASDRGSLLVSGKFLEVLGQSTIDGFESVQLQSDGDLRLRGVLQTGQATITGSLRTGADLTLRADQVYGSTLSNFTLAVEGDDDGVLRIESTGEPRATVLSAGSHLTLRAPTIEQAGVLRAPFGTIEFDGEDVRLESGSLTSTSAEGAIVPYGTTQAGDDWVYSLRSNTRLVLGDTTEVPQQTVALAGERVAVDTGAVIDVSGGGDLLAYEFVPGPTGKQDVLSALEQPGQFAVVPGLNIDYAPFDPQESVDSTLTVGDSVHLSGGVAGLPEGNYVLLPARYALLKGAYLVRPTEGLTDLRSGSAYAQLSGSTIISGRRVIANTQFADARTSGFEVLPSSVVTKLAKYDTSLASEFFVEQAEANGTAVARLPQDAGVLAFTAGEQLQINGSLRASAGEDGRGAGVDISARNLCITEGEAGEGEVAVSAASLSRLGAESLLLGGRRSSTDDGTSIDVAADNVTVDAGTSLSAPEILIAAADTVRVAGGATVAAAGEVSAADTYLVDGDSAVLRLASGEQAEIRRDNEAGSAGTLILEQGAQLTATGGALALDASLDTRSDATLGLSGGSLSLGASRINLGAAPDDAGGLTLDDSRLSGLNLDELVLVSRSTIDLYGDVTLAVDDVALDAAGIRGVAQAEGGSITAAKSIVLTNRAERETADADTSPGTLALNASEIVIGQGTQRISGYESVNLNASTRVRGEDKGGLSVAGDLTVVTPAVVAATAANTTVTATGAFNMRSASDSVAGVQGAELGGKLTLKGESVNIATRVEAAAGVVSIAATTGDLTLSQSALIDVTGRERDFDGILVAAPAGNVKLSSERGDVITRAGSTIDVSAAGRGAAGSINVSAIEGSLSLAGAMSGTAQASTASGQFSVDALNVGDFSALNTTLNAGGFFSERELRQRSGNLTVSAGDSVQAHDVSLTADQGDVLVRGTIDARGANGGDVVLSAQRAVHVSGAILANATDAAGEGGEVDLRALSGLSLDSSAVVDVSAGVNAEDGDGGEVRMRVDRTALLQGGVVRTDAVQLAGTIRGAERTWLEAVKVYAHADAAGGILAGTDGVITSAFTAANTSNVLFAEAQQFMNSESAIRTALGRADDASFILAPGIEIQADEDLSLGTATQIVNWNLYTWRFGANLDAPGILTLRAGNNLTINGALSDGFMLATDRSTTGTLASPGAWRLPTASVSNSWSYRLVAGADHDSADVMAVDATAATAIVDGNGDVVGKNGSFSIAAGPGGTGTAPLRMVRTGNGSIDVAAAGDFVLGNQQSVLYTAGVASPDGFNVGNNTAGLGARAYPVNGGDISIDVLGDVEGAKTGQLATDWLWRVGESPNLNNGRGWATGWTVNFARFEQNVAALGGGDVSVSAGGDVRDFSVSIPSIGQQVGGPTAADSVVDVIGGGTLDVYAGGNIIGGSYYVGRGTGNLHADGDVARTSFGNASPYPILALGDGEWNVSARGSAGIEGVVNPTLLPHGFYQKGPQLRPTFYSTYAPDSAVNIQSVSGDLMLSNNTDYMGSVLTSMAELGNDGAEKMSLQIRPPTLRAVALSGDLTLSGEMTLYPAAGSTVELLAEGSVIRDPNPDVAIVQLRQSDADPAALPTIEVPFASADALVPVLGGIDQSITAQHAPIPVHAGDDSVARIVARTGDVTFASSSATDSSMLSFSTPVRIVAGGDIVDLPLSVQHDDANDITSLVAGGDIRYQSSRLNEGANLGGIIANTREIMINGPGLLQLAAAGDIDLQTSAGITTRGNVGNPNLPDGGASISVMAGASESQADYDAVIERYLELGTGYDTELVKYIEARTGETELTLEEARARFDQLSAYRRAMLEYVERRSGRDDLTEQAALETFRGYTASEQREVLERVVFSELKFSGRDAASSGSDDFRRGFTALETLFPGANPAPESNETNPYSGDLALYFSRIYTLDGGDISLLAPGGEVNVGLAAPPVSFGLPKGASDLGLVVQSTGSVNSLSYRDFAVNESRVFAADGGDIMVWSTDGDIDAGRGAKTAISAPAPTITFDQNGRMVVDFPAALTGSGIQTLATSKGVERGNVDLFAPRGVVNAGDAGIVAGNLTIAATAVLGADNIQVSGVAVGVPVDAGGLGASLAGVTAAASSAANSATTAVEGERDAEKQSTTLADTALSWLEVFVVGLGEENCAQSDVECLKRQPTR